MSGWKLAGAVAAAVVLVPGTAGAVDVEVRGDTVVVRDADGVANDLGLYATSNVTVPGETIREVRVYDSRRPPTPGSGCAIDGPNSITCVVRAPVPVLDASLGDEADDVRVFGMEGGLHTGAGADTVTLTQFGRAPAPSARVDAGSGGDIVAIAYGIAVGGDGDDSLRSLGAHEGGTGLDDVTLLGGDGDDVVNGSGGSHIDVLADGGAGADRLTVGWGAVARGGDGDDTLLSHHGSPLDGGRGADLSRGGTVRYDGRTGGVVVTLNGVADDGARGEGDNVIDPVALHGTPFADELVGSPQPDILVGEAGDDLIAGGAGSDWLFGDTGRDRIRARDGEEDRIGCGADDAQDIALIDLLDVLFEDADCEHAAVG